jgi:hypothetical protein
LESLKLCAYNQTVERFLGMDIVAAEFTDATLKDWMLTLTPRSGAGLWIVPFRGIPESAVRFLLDLVYLDEDCRVVDVVESFPAFRVSTSSPSATSVLVLPAHSISSSQTKPGDQLDIDVDERIGRKLKKTLYAGEVGNSQNARPKWGPGIRDIPTEQLSFHESQINEASSSQPAMPVIISESHKSKVERLRSWLNLRFSPRSVDSRKAPREQSPGLIAHFWTGATPEAHTIRDISSSGAFVVTKERWYLGTTIRVLLTKTEKYDMKSERSICVHSKAVRWGNDGVGLHFVLKDNLKNLRHDTALEDGANRKELDLFLDQLKNFGQPRPPILATAARN